MAQANRRSMPEQPAEVMDADRLHEHIAALLLEATGFVSPARVEETARGWLARTEHSGATVQEALLVADALPDRLTELLTAPASRLIPIQRGPSS